jgi:predicted NAD/FAD-binding protein
LNTRIQSVTRLGEQVALDDIHGNREIFDDVVFACHSDQALALLADPTTEEQALLSCFPYQRNRAFLHLDTDLMPKRKQVWSSWNYLTSNKPASKNEQLISDQKRKVSVSYWMNQLQPLATEQPVMVSLNPLKMPRSGTIIRSFFYDHPAFDQSSLAAQKQLWSLQGKQHTWFCGAYFGYGFHEDGLQSGLAVAEALGGVVRPWQLEEPNSRIEIHTGSLPNTAVELYCV